MGFQSLKKMLEDIREWCTAARVEVIDGEEQHFRYGAEGDIDVSVRTVVHDGPIWAHLDSLAGGADGSGVWHIPDPGTEVMVCFDQGDYEGEAHIVSRTSGGRAPQGLGPGIIFIIGNDVRAMSPGGSPKSVAFQDSVDNLRKYVRDQLSATSGHTHVVVGGATTTIAAAADGAGALSAPTNPPDPIEGTDVVKLE